MSTAIGDLVASLNLNTAPFSSAISVANQHLTRLNVATGSAGSALSALASGPLGVLQGAFSRLGDAASLILSPLGAMWATLKESALQVLNLINPLTWLNKAFQGLMYPLQWCMRELESAFDVPAAIDNAVRFEKVTMRLQTLLRNTGEAAGYTYAQLKKMAGGNVGRMEAMAPLLMAGNIKGPNFGDAFRLTKDLAIAMGSDLPTAAQKMARALGSPETASRALRQANIFLDQSTKDLIKSLVKQGDVAGAQAVILDILQSKTAGMAQAYAGTLGGQMAKFKRILEEISVGFGLAIKPVMMEVIALFQQMAEWINSNRALFLDLGVKAAAAFHGMTAPLSQFFALLRSDTPSALAVLNTLWNRMIDRMADGIELVKRMFLGLLDVMTGGAGWDATLKAPLHSLAVAFGDIADYFVMRLIHSIQTIAPRLATFMGIKDINADQKTRFKDWGDAANDSLSHAGSMFSKAFSQIGANAPSFLNMGVLTAGLGVDSARTQAALEAEKNAKASVVQGGGVAGGLLNVAKRMWSDSGAPMLKTAQQVGAAIGDHAQQAMLKGRALAARVNALIPLEGKQVALTAEKPSELQKIQERGSDAAWKTMVDALYGKDKNKAMEDTAANTARAADKLEEIADNQAMMEDI